MDSDSPHELFNQQGSGNKGRESVLWGHISIGTIEPLAGLLDVYLKSENYGVPLDYDCLTPEVMRAEFGRQWGPQSIILPQMVRKQMLPAGWFLKQTLFPGNLSPVYPRTAVTPALACQVLAGVVILTLVLTYLYRRNRQLVAGCTAPFLVAYTASVLPVGGFVRQFGSTDISDRYSYVPAIMILFAVGKALEELLRKYEKTKDSASAGAFVNTIGMAMERRIHTCIAVASVAYLSVYSQYHMISWRDYLARHRAASMADSHYLEVLVLLVDCYRSAGMVWEAAACRDELDLLRSNL